MSSTEPLPVVFTAQSKLHYYRRDAVCEFVFRNGAIPLHPFRLFGYFLDDRVERDLVRQANNNLLRRADELWVFGEEVSDGVLFEIQYARELGKTIRFFTIASRAVAVSRWPIRAGRRNRTFMSIATRVTPSAFSARPNARSARAKIAPPWPVPNALACCGPSVSAVTVFSALTSSVSRPTSSQKGLEGGPVARSDGELMGNAFQPALDRGVAGKPADPCPSAIQGPNFLRHTRRLAQPYRACRRSTVVSPDA